MLLVVLFTVVDADVPTVVTLTLVTLVAELSECDPLGEAPVGETVKVEPVVGLPDCDPLEEVPVEETIEVELVAELSECDPLEEAPAEETFELEPVDAPTVVCPSVVTAPSIPLP